MSQLRLLYTSRPLGYALAWFFVLFSSCTGGGILSLEDDNSPQSFSSGKNQKSGPNPLRTKINSGTLSEAEDSIADYIRYNYRVRKGRHYISPAARLKMTSRLFSLLTKKEKEALAKNIEKKKKGWKAKVNSVLDEKLGFSTKKEHEQKREQSDKEAKAQQQLKAASQNAKKPESSKQRHQSATKDEGLTEEDPKPNPAKIRKCIQQQEIITEVKSDLEDFAESSAHSLSDDENSLSDDDDESDAGATAETISESGDSVIKWVSLL